MTISPLGPTDGDTILPGDVVPGMQTDVEAVVANATHDVARAAADVGPGKERSIQERPHPVVADDRGSLHLAQKAWAEHALDGAAGVVGPDAEQERRRRIVPAQHRHERSEENTSE